MYPLVVVSSPCYLHVKAYAGNKLFVALRLLVQLPDEHQFVGQNLQHCLAEESEGGKETDKGHVEQGEQDGRGNLHDVQHFVQRRALCVQPGQCESKRMRCSSSN